MWDGRHIAIKPVITSQKTIKTIKQNNKYQKIIILKIFTNLKEHKNQFEKINLV